MNGSGEGDEEGGGERKPGNLLSHSRGGSEDAREELTPTRIQQPQPQGDPTPQRDRHLIGRTRAHQGREARDMIGKRGGGTRKRKKSQKS